MKQEEELLMKDLGARLLYKPMVEYKGETYNVLGITHGRLVLCKPFMSYTLDECPLVEEVKPYLFPFSSMTLEQRWKAQNLLPDKCEISFTNSKIEFYGEDYHKIKLEQFENLFNLFNMWYLDYRGLIPMGLANDATGLNIY